MTDIYYIAVQALKPHERNPRKITGPEFEALKKDLEKDKDFFHDRPLLVNRVGDKMTVYAGNQRLQAAKKLGWKEVPCIVRDDLDEETIKRRSILDNKHRGIWDYDILAADFEIPELLDFGFKQDELMGIFENQDDIPPDDKENKKEKTKVCPSCGHEF